MFFFLHVSCYAVFFSRLVEKSNVFRFCGGMWKWLFYRKAAGCPEILSPALRPLFGGGNCHPLASASPGSLGPLLSTGLPWALGEGRGGPPNARGKVKRMKLMEKRLWTVAPLEEECSWECFQNIVFKIDWTMGRGEPATGGKSYS